MQKGRRRRQGHPEARDRTVVRGVAERVHGSIGEEDPVAIPTRRTYGGSDRSGDQRRGPEVAGVTKGVDAAIGFYQKSLSMIQMAIRTPGKGS